MLRQIDRAILGLNRLLLIVALAAMSVIVFANVMLRYTTGDSIVWAEEVARYLMIWLAYLGIGPVLRLGGHMAIDTLQAGLGEPRAKLLRLLIVLLMACFSAAMVWIGVDFVDRTSVQSTPVTDISFSWIAAAIPVGFALNLWHLLAVARGYVTDREFEVSADLDPDQAASI
ncbi:TRAP transporter small permease [Ferrovibrio sp.]|jgi:TRAP-type C4-dicarboxylate transport system permease small subunit|uniref:TRAP transporter small permease n=1 Tax=Ferrovibrio sp. TaxID=1917215 RepID=UPI0035AEEB1D